MTDTIVSGWVHNIRDHKHIIFIQLWMPNEHDCPLLVTDKDTSDSKCARRGRYLQCVIKDPECADKITMQAYLRLTGDMVLNVKSPTYGEEMQVKEVQLLGKGDNEFRSEINTESETYVLVHKRHMLHWAPRQLAPMKDRFAAAKSAHECTRLRDQLYGTIYKTYSGMGFTKVDPPTITKIQTEGGSTLFKVDYYGTPAYLTQSSQMYLESVLPGYGNVWCLESSYRAERSSTPRHLAEYKHLEAELIVDTLTELMDHVKLIISTLYESAGLGPQEFMTMTHAEAVKQLNEIRFRNPSGGSYGPRSDLNDKAEMKLLELHKCPIFITHFPACIKAFYMKRHEPSKSDAESESDGLTESFDLLLPGVGEVVGGSLRMTDYDQLMEAFKTQEIDPAPYYWYTDLRRYGSCPHGGYGIGIERLIKAIMFASDKPIPHVRDACLYPVYYS